MKKLIYLLFIPASFLEIFQTRFAPLRLIHRAYLFFLGLIIKKHPMVDGNKKYDLQYRRYEKIVDLVESQFSDKTIKILDVGCGNGNLLKMLSEHGFSNLHGCDFMQINPEFAQFDLINLNEDYLAHYDDNYFDLVISSDVLEHLENPAKTFREFSRITNTEGRVIFSIPNAWNIFERCRYLIKGDSSRYKAEKTKESYSHISYLTSNVLYSLFQRADLKLEKRLPTYNFLFGYFWETTPMVGLSYNLIYMLSNKD